LAVTAISIVPLVCETDNETIEKAKQLVDGHDVELWRLDRKVAEFKQNQGTISQTRTLPNEGRNCVVRNCSMCDKCAVLDRKIDHYEQMLLSIGDRVTVERLHAMIAELQAQKVALHPEPKQKQ
jgi:hypothetical protein